MQLRHCLVSLLQQVDHEFTPPLSTRLSIEAYADKLLANAVILPHVEGGELKAFVGMYCNDEARSTAYISMVATAPAGRGQGLASGLIGLAIGVARRRGFRRIALEVYRSNTAALALYRKLGFVVSGESEQSLFLSFETSSI